MLKQKKKAFGRDFRGSSHFVNSATISPPPPRFFPRYYDFLVGAYQKAGYAIAESCMKHSDTEQDTQKSRLN